MLNVDQIERSNDQSEQSQPDAVRHSESPVDSLPELPAGRRATRSIAPITAKRPDATATTTDQRSSSQDSPQIRWMTDDARVEADKVGISTDVSGIAH
jgi:hypothetical protein